MNFTYFNKISFCFVLVAFLGLTQVDAQYRTVINSDSLIVHIYKDSIPPNAKATNIKFLSEFRDTVSIYLDNKCVFSNYVETEKSTGTSIDIPYFKVWPRKNSELKIKFLKEDFTVTTQFIKGYNYLYIYKRNKRVTLSYEKEQLFFE